MTTQFFKHYYFYLVLNKINPTQRFTRFFFQSFSYKRLLNRGLIPITLNKTKVIYLVNEAKNVFKFFKLEVILISFQER